MTVEPHEQCPGCGAAWLPEDLDCRICHRLRHSARLTQLANDATRLADEQKWSDSLAQWRNALDLLPPASKQYAQVHERIRVISQRLDAPGQAPASGGKNRAAQGAAGATAVGAALLKFKFAIVFVLAKAKFLLLGLGKLSTLISMLVAFGAYGMMFGWRFGAGFVLSIYVHEMGHVAALRRYGIAATAPMFIPGFGALVRLKQYPVDPREDATVGLAGPWWGFFAAIAASAIGSFAHLHVALAVGRTGAWLNLFNLVPIWQLDGGRGFRALNKMQRMLALGVIVACWFASGENLLILLALAAGYRAFEKGAPTEPNWRATFDYIALTVGLTALAALGGSALAR